MSRLVCFVSAVFGLGCWSLCGLANAQVQPVSQDEIIQQYKDNIADQDARNSLSEDSFHRRPTGIPALDGIVAEEDESVKRAREETERLMERMESRRKFNEKWLNSDGSLRAIPREPDTNLDDNGQYNPIGWLLGTVGFAAAFYALVLWVKSRNALNGGNCRKCGRKWRLAYSEPNHYTSTELRHYTCKCGAETQRVTGQGATDPTDSPQ